MYTRLKNRKIVQQIALSVCLTLVVEEAHPNLVAQAVLGDHGPGQASGLHEVAGGPRGHIRRPEHHLLG